MPRAGTRLTFMQRKLQSAAKRSAAAYTWRLEGRPRQPVCRTSRTHQSEAVTTPDGPSGGANETAHSVVVVRGEPGRLIALIAARISTLAAGQPCVGLLQAPAENSKTATIPVAINAGLGCRDLGPRAEPDNTTGIVAVRKRRPICGGARVASLKSFSVGPHVSRGT